MMKFSPWAIPDLDADVETYQLVISTYQQRNKELAVVADRYSAELRIKYQGSHRRGRQRAIRPKKHSQPALLEKTLWRAQ